MLEILAILWLSNANGRKAQERGRKPGPYKVLTFLLWFGGEILGFLVGYSVTDEPLPAYGYAIGFAVVGAILSRIIVSAARRGDYHHLSSGPLPGAQKLGSPVPLLVTREKSFVGALATLSFRLNGEDIGDLKNGDTLKARTSWRQNVLVATDRQGNESPPLTFAVAEGLEARLTFRAGRFVEGAHQGILPLSEENVAELAAGRPLTVPDIVAGADGPAALPGAVSRAVPTDPPQPLRAFLLLGAALLCLPLTALLLSLSRGAYFYNVWQSSGQAMRGLLVPLLWGGSLYLFLQRQTKQWVFALVMLLLTPFLAAFANVYRMGFPFARLVSLPIFRTQLLTLFIEAVLVAGVGLLFGFRRDAENKLAAPAWTLAALLAAYAFYSNRIAYLQQAPIQITLDPLTLLNIAIFSLVGALTAVAAAFYCRALCRLRSKRVTLSGGARFWCILVAVASGAAQIVALVNTRVLLDPWGLVLTAIAILGMILLSTNRRVGFLLALLGVGGNALLGLDTLYAILYLHRNYLPLGTAAGAALNLCITWALIRNAWLQRPSRREGTGATYGPAHWVYWAAGIIDMLFGGAAFGVGFWYQVFETREIEAGPLSSMAVGVAFFLIGLFCVLHCRRRRKRPAKALLVIGLVLAIIVVLAMGFAFFQSVSYRSR